MSDFVCPKEIADLFNSEKTKSRGRRRALEWEASLALSVGDRVWLPDIGWTVKGVDPA